MESNNKSFSTIVDAFYNWNATHSDLEKDQLYPGSTKLNELGKTLFVHYSKKKGYWLSELTWAQRIVRFFFYRETYLTPKQSEELRSIKNLYLYHIAKKSVASRSIKENQAIEKAHVMKVFCGDKVAHAYAILFSEPFDENAFKKLVPELNEILNTISKSFIIHQHSESFNLIGGDLTRLITSILQQGGRYDPELQARYNAAQSKMYETITKTMDVFRLYYAKTLDAVKPTSQQEVHFKELNRLQREIALTSVLADLRTFQQKFQVELTDEQRENLKKGVEELACSSKVFFDYPTGEAPKEVFENQAFQIYAKLQKIENQEAVLLPVGTGRHAVICKIEKTENGTFTLSVINTGEGSIAKGTMVEHGVTHNLTRDILYRNLTLDDLSSGFLIKLCQLSCDRQVRMTGADSFYDLLDRTFLHEGSKASKEEGQVRRMQHQGTCATKCVLEALRDTLGGELYRAFEVEMIRGSIHSIEEEITIISDVALKRLFPRASKTEATRYLKDLVDSGKVVLQQLAGGAKAQSPYAVFQELNQNDKRPS